MDNQTGQRFEKAAHFFEPLVGREAHMIMSAYERLPERLIAHHHKYLQLMRILSTLLTPVCAFGISAIGLAALYNQTAQTGLNLNQTLPIDKAFIPAMLLCSPAVYRSARRISRDAAHKILTVDREIKANIRALYGYSDQDWEEIKSVSKPDAHGLSL